MSKKLQTAIVFGSGMTFAFCVMSFMGILKGEDMTAQSILRSFAAALVAGIASGIVAYFFADKFNPNQMDQ